MLTYLTRRLLASVPVLLGVSLLTFSMVHLVPGDPVRTILGTDADLSDIENIRRELGLDRPLVTQYLNYLRSAVTLDMGQSIRTGLPVAREIRNRLPATLMLGSAAFVFSCVIGILLGIAAAVRRGTIWDTLTMFGATLGVAAPTFWVGLLLILVFSIELQWLPSGGRGGLGHIVLPALTLGLHYSATMARITRSSMLEVLNEEYIRTARSKGLAPWRTVYGHGLKNALIPVLTIVGLQFGALISGSLVVETVFSWPGLGSLLVDAIKMRNFPVVQSTILLISILFLVANLTVDVLYAATNPRIRYG